MLPYVLLTLGEVLVSATGLEFAYSQAPGAMKGIIMSFWSLSVTFGNLWVLVTNAAVRDDVALQRPDLLAGRQPRVINMSTIGADLLRPASPGFGPRIEAVIVYNSNPVAVAPESRKVVKGFARDDLFTVVLEHFLTDTADQADYVLPATMQPEHWDVHTTYGHTWVMVNEPVVAPPGQARSNAAIFRALAARMDLSEPCFADDDETLARMALVPGLVDFETLRTQGWFRLPLPDAPFADGGFPTPDGRVRISAPALGWGLPDHVAPWESAESDPALAARYLEAVKTRRGGDQQAVARELVGLLRGGQAAQPGLGGQAGQQGQSGRAHVDPGQRPGDQGDDADEQQREGHLGQGEQHAGGEESSGRLQAADLGRQGADAGRAAIQSQVTQDAEDLGRDLLVDLGGDAVELAGADHPQRQVEHQQQGDDAAQGPQGGMGEGRDDAVVDLLREQTGGHGQTAGEQGGDSHLGQQAAALAQAAPDQGAAGLGGVLVLGPGAVGPVQPDGGTGVQGLAGQGLAQPLGVFQHQGFALGVFGGLLGSLTLALRRSVAVPVLAASLVGYVGVLVAQAAALVEAGESAAASAVLSRLSQSDVMGYQPYWVTLSHAEIGAGRPESARQAFERAIGLTEDPAVRAFLRNQLNPASRKGQVVG